MASLPTLNQVPMWPSGCHLNGTSLNKVQKRNPSGVSTDCKKESNLLQCYCAACEVLNQVTIPSGCICVNCAFYCGWFNTGGDGGAGSKPAASCVLFSHLLNLSLPNASYNCVVSASNKSFLPSPPPSPTFRIPTSRPPLCPLPPPLFIQF